jgi:hypothetical protein
MPGRRRPLAIILASAVAFLVLGRFGAQFITERLWEADVSGAAALVGTRFALLGAALEVAGILSAFIWFLLHFGFAARAVVLEFGDLPRPLGHLSERAVYWPAPASGSGPCCSRRPASATASPTPCSGGTSACS